MRDEMPRKPKRKSPDVEPDGDEDVDAAPPDNDGLPGEEETVEEDPDAFDDPDLAAPRGRATDGDGIDEH